MATINKENKIINIVEKPKKTKSKLAITGLYFFDNNVIKFSKSLKMSKRKEIFGHGHDKGAKPRIGERLRREIGRGGRPRVGDG